jgi:biopolymer transport protein ExbD
MKLNRRHRSPEIQLATPGMIDIVFLLLIFFLVNSSFRPIERQLASQLADPNAGASADQEPLVVQLRVAPAVGGQPQVEFQVGGRRFSDRTALGQWLATWPDRQQPVLLLSPMATPVEIGIATLNDLRQLGFSRVAYVPEVTPSALPNR